MTDLTVVPQATQWKRLKALVLDSVSSPITRRVYNLGLDEFIAWYALAVTWDWTLIDCDPKECRSAWCRLGGLALRRGQAQRIDIDWPISLFDVNHVPAIP